jgi:hypothetical protein
MYRAYCRSATQASCNPASIGIGLAVLVLAYLAHGLIGTVISHESAIVHVFLVAAATVLSCVAGLLLVQAMRTVVRAVGTHVSPACPVPARSRTATAAAPAGAVLLGVRRDGTPVTADVPAGSYTWRLRPPADERLPGKSDLVTGKVNWDAMRLAQSLPPDPDAVEAAAMNAEADVLADDEAGIVVSEHGGIYVLAGDDGTAP